MKNALVVSPEIIFRGGLRGVPYAHGEILQERDHRICVLSQFPLAYMSHARETPESLLDFSIAESHFSHLEALVVHVTHENVGHIAHFGAIDRVRTELVWLLTGTVDSALTEISRAGLERTRIFRARPDFAAQALGLIAASWPEESKIIRPDHVDQIHPLRGSQRLITSRLVESVR